MDYEDTFTDATGDGTTLEVNDNADGLHVCITVTDPDGSAITIALTADQVEELAATLHMLAAGV